MCNERSRVKLEKKKKKILTLYAIDTHFDTLTTSENFVRKGEIARNEQFLLFPQCFLHDQINVSPNCPYF